MSKKLAQNIVVPYGVSENLFMQNYRTPSRINAPRLNEKGQVVTRVAKEKEALGKTATRKASYYDNALKRQETRVSVTPFATIERARDGQVVGKYIHSPYIISEKYQTEFEIVERVKKAVGKAVVATLAVCATVFAILWVAGVIIINT